MTICSHEIKTGLKFVFFTAKIRRAKKIDAIGINCVVNLWLEYIASERRQ